jgi:glutamyl/glutaminyl-tRNA synthetase
MSVRFAPSPTGEFHVGNLRTAWISHALSRALKLPWVVRFEDIDRARVVSGAQERQLEDLALLGLVPDQVFVQSAAHTRHQALFDEARLQGQVYPCTCSRREVQEHLRWISSAPQGEPHPIYDGRCRRGPETPALETVAWRFRDSSDSSGTRDFVMGRTRDLQGRDFAPAYHWACAVDDLEEAHSLLVRAWDLEQALAPQRKIQAWIRALRRSNALYPAVFHTALVTDNHRGRLEKRTRGVTLKEWPGGASSLTDAFRRSWDQSLALCFRPALVWGEAEKTLTLSRLKEVLHEP